MDGRKPRLALPFRLEDAHHGPHPYLSASCGEGPCACPYVKYLWRGASLAYPELMARRPVLHMAVTAVVPASCGTPQPVRLMSSETTVSSSQSAANDTNQTWVKQPLLNHNSKMWWCQNSNGHLSVQAPTPLSSTFLSTTAIPTVKPSRCMSFGIQP